MPSFFENWFPFIYLYGVGGFFFFSGLILIIKSGALDPKIKRHKRWLKIMLSGFFFFLILHAFLITAAIYL